MLLRLLLLFTAVPLLEVYLLIEVGTRLGAVPTIGLVIVTGIAGCVLARTQGLAVLQRMRRQLQQGRLPAGTLFDGLLILIAGVVLITPGLLTDCLGFLLLIPASRKVFKRWLKRRIQESLSRGEIRVYAELPGDDAQINR